MLLLLVGGPDDLSCGALHDHPKHESNRRDGDETREYNLHHLINSVSFVHFIGLIGSGGGCKAFSMFPSYGKNKDVGGGACSLCIPSRIAFQLCNGERA